MIGSGLVRRTLAVADVIIPFTPTTYDDAYRDRRLAGDLPPVSFESAMALPAAYACTTVISEDIAKVPLQMFEMRGEDREVARQHPLYDVLHDEPNEEQSALEFREWMTAVALNRGIAVAEIKAGRRGPVDQLVPLEPGRLTRERLRDGTVRLRYEDPVKGTRNLLRDEVFVLRGRFGVGVVHAMRQAFATMLSQQRLQGEMYGRGLRTPGFLTHKDKLSDPGRENLRKALDEYTASGERAGRPMLLEEGMEWRTIALSFEDAQFLESLQDGYAQTCMAYRVPQHKVQMLMRATNNNIEQQSVDYVTDSLVAWAVRWEQAIRRDLVLNPARFFPRHNLEGLLRGDLKTRYEAYAIACQIGWMTRAEVREKEDMRPREGLDEPLQMLNMGNVADTSVALDTGSVRVTTFRPDVQQPSSPAVVSYLRTLVRDGAARVVRTEVNELGKLAKKTGGRGQAWDAGVRAFFDGHAETVERVLRISGETAVDYCAEREAVVVSHGPGVLTDDIDYMGAVASLTRVALRQADVLQLPAGDSEAEAIAA